MKAIMYSSLFTFHFSLFTSCTDGMIDAAGSNSNGDDYHGGMIQFTAGTTDNSTSSRAAKTYYMAQGSHFVCRMYHKNQNSSEDFDVSTPEDAWLMVNSDIGNSVYWESNYPTTGITPDDNGNDPAANFLYWRNRRSHAFLAWTDNNRLSDITYSTDQGGLKFSPYDKLITTNETKRTWMDTGYQIYGVKDSLDDSKLQIFTSWADLKDYIEGLNDEELEEFKTTQQNYPGTEKFSNSYYEYGWSCKYFVSDEQGTSIDQTTKTSAWIKYLMYYEKYDYTLTGIDEIVVKDKNDVPIFLKDSNGNYLAEIVFDDSDTEHLHPHYYITDIHGNVRYNEDKPRYTFYMKRTSVLQDAEIKGEYRANVFDLTRGTKESMTEQPDILQALVIKEPASATLQANRIDLYFKHQFSQVQVNIKNSEDNSVQIDSTQIDKVELLGVTNEGYIFTELLANGEVRPTSYKDVVATDYTNEELEANPYGTSFEMFPRTMTDDEKAATKAIKSFECITFGLLQAIRITWHETEAEGGKVHNSTYRVGDINLENLASGTRYIWNMELRRGTLAVVRTEIIPWEQNEETYSTDGTIKK